ncbi:MAG: flavodoxin family protein [Halanaeroarchaeum sp.]
MHPTPAPESFAGRIAVVYYSRTGTTERVATDLADRVPRPAVQHVEPTTERRYPTWLLLSFVPGATVPIADLQTDLRQADALLVGTPKWTLACPPTNAFVRALEATDVPTGLFVTYGGFDERRFADDLARRLVAAGADLRATLLVQRDAVGADDYADGLETFLDAVIDDR